MSNWADNEEIKIFREYLRIPTVTPNADYTLCVEFLRRQADDLGLDFQVFHPSKPEKPVVIITWMGKKPELESILLNSHMDVVPVHEDLWTHKPFAADIDEQGNIIARGSQDTKCTGTQYLGALRYFRKNDIHCDRTIHLTYVPDEEIGGADGMEAFVKTEVFKKLNIGFVIDESEPSTREKEFVILYGERANWEVILKISGASGHASYMEKNTAAEKLSFILSKIYEYRASQMKILEKDPLNFGDSISMNATIINGGLQINVVPAEFSVSIDIRLGTNVDHVEFEKMIRNWCEEAGGDIDIIFDMKDPYVEPTDIGETNLYWDRMKNAIEEMGYKAVPIICAGATDCRFIRPLGIPALGFSPISNVQPFLHGNNEYLPANMYLEGIEIFKKIIEKIASV